MSGIGSSSGCPSAESRERYVLDDSGTYELRLADPPLEDDRWSDAPGPPLQRHPGEHPPRLRFGLSLLTERGVSRHLGKGDFDPSPAPLLYAQPRQRLSGGRRDQFTVLRMSLRALFENRNALLEISFELLSCFQPLPQTRNGLRLLALAFEQSREPLEWLDGSWSDGKRLPIQPRSDLELTVQLMNTGETGQGPRFHLLCQGIAVSELGSVEITALTSDVTDGDLYPVIRRRETRCFTEYGRGFGQRPALIRRAREMKSSARRARGLADGAGQPRDGCFVITATQRQTSHDLQSARCRSPRGTARGLEEEPGFEEHQSQRVPHLLLLRMPTEAALGDLEESPTKIRVIDGLEQVRTKLGRGDDVTNSP